MKNRKRHFKTYRFQIFKKSTNQTIPTLLWEWNLKILPHLPRSNSWTWEKPTQIFKIHFHCFFFGQKHEQLQAPFYRFFAKESNRIFWNFFIVCGIFIPIALFTNWIFSLKSSLSKRQFLFSTKYGFLGVNLKYLFLENSSLIIFWESIIFFVVPKKKLQTHHKK